MDDVVDFIDALNALPAAGSLTKLRLDRIYTGSDDDTDSTSTEEVMKILTSISKVETLRFLNLGDVQIHGGLSPLSSLVNRAHRALNGDEVHGDLSPLSSLVNLTYLFLYGNQIHGDPSLLLLCVCHGFL